MAKELHLQFYDQIGSDFWSGEGTTAKTISAQLAANADASEIILHINSPGGSVYEGYTIYNLLKASGKKITAKIEGYCASIATLIALSAEEIEMLPLAQWLIHNPFTSIDYADADDLIQAAEELKRIESVLVGIYVARTGKAESEIRALMQDDRFINADEAVEMGFATRVLEPLKAVAFYKSKKTNKPEIEMNEDVQNSFADKILNGIKELLKPKNEGEPTPPAAPVASSETLENDSLIYFEGELSEGTMVFTDAEMTLSAADGEYTLKDGRVLTVEAGAVKAIAAAAPENSAELEAAQNRVKELETELEALKATAAAQVNTINNLKKIVPGGTGGKAGVPPQNHAADGQPAAELVPFNNAAEKLKAKYKRN